MAMNMHRYLKSAHPFAVYVSRSVLLDENKEGVTHGRMTGPIDRWDSETDGGQADTKRCAPLGHTWLQSVDVNMMETPFSKRPSPSDAGHVSRALSG